MDMTKLSDVLLSDSQRGQSQEGFLDAWERFVRFFQGLYRRFLRSQNCGHFMLFSA